MIKTLIPCYDALLHTKVQKCSYNLDRSKISYRLHENMYHYNGIGLSANQIGINERVFVAKVNSPGVYTRSVYYIFQFRFLPFEPEHLFSILALPQASIFVKKKRFRKT